MSERPLGVLTSDARERLGKAALEGSFVEIADAFTDELLDDLDLEIPEPGSLASRLGMRELGFGFRRLDELFGSPEMLRMLEQISGERTLVYDFEYELGGLRQATEPGPQRLVLGRHKRGWRRRLTVIVCLDPAWTGGGPEAPPPQPARRCRLLIARSGDRSSPFELTPAPTRCRYVIAHYYAQGAAPEKPRDTQAAEPPILERMRGLDGQEIEELITEELTRIAASVQRRSSAMLEEIERYRKAIWQSTSDGSAPMGEGELETLARLPERWRSALRLLEEAQRDAEEVAAVTRGFPPLPLEGAATVQRQQGRWRDGWVGQRLRLRLVPERPIHAIVIEGTVPEALRESQRLNALVAESIYQLLPPIGDFRWRFATSHTLGEPLQLVIDAKTTWCPVASGASGDKRPLAWLLRRVIVES